MTGSPFVIAILDPEGEKLEIVEGGTGNTHHILTNLNTFTSDFQLLTTYTEITRQPHFLENLLGDWWPKGSAKRQQVRVAEVASGRELSRLESDSLEEALLSDDGKTLVTKHQENGKYLMRVWDVPLRPPLLLVIGIPLGLGLMVFLFSRLRAGRKIWNEAAASSVTPEPSPTIGK